MQHRIASLPETRRLAELSAEREQVDGSARDARILVDDLGREQRKADADVEQVKSRRTRDQDRMDRGLITNPRDLEHLQQELTSLTRRIGDLEDAELEVMARLEDAQRDLDQASNRLGELDDEIGQVSARRGEQTQEITAQGREATTQRAEAARDLPEDLLALYERLRAQKNGVGAAALRQRRCEGCSLQLNAADLGALANAAADDVVRCEECGRILVRTVDSGL